MESEDLIRQLQQVDDRSQRNEGSIKKLENESSALHQLVTSVAVMGQNLETMNDNLKTLNTKVDELESKPAKRWDSLIAAVIGAAAGAFLAWLFSGAPGM